MMKTTDVKTWLRGWLLFLLAILSGIIAKATWPGVDASLVTVIVFAAGIVIILLWNRRAKSKGGGYGIGDTGDGDGTGDGSAGDSGGGGV